MWIVRHCVCFVDSQKVPHGPVHSSGELCPLVTVYCEWCAVFVDPFMDYDVHHYHSFFGGYRSTFSPFGKVVLQHDNILIPTLCPMERSNQVDRHSLVESSMSGLL